MKFNLKKHQTYKFKQFLKKESFLILSINTNKNSKRWAYVEQGLHKLKFNYYKIYNNTSMNAIKNSTQQNLLKVMCSTFFFLKPKNFNKKLLKTNILNELNSIFFTVLAVKINQIVYSTNQIKNLTVLNYRKTISILYQFLKTNLKSSIRIKTKKV